MSRPKRIITIILFLLCLSAISGVVRSILVRFLGGYDALILGISFFIVFMLTLMLYRYYNPRNG
jgi:hypothetical protein